ncbi:unnamed protein product [Adineta steineri]|uniref:Uncharacterized protein n=1 Tax=Adineta steineri TaxID=433720 RepID=A0A814SHE5_9BILA|nr:unnamed protein product [Adineta steineri]CAF3856887.1 unnamed protein product [Adineta steineri]
MSITNLSNNNNEIYEKIQPLKTRKDQAHGDDTHNELFSYENQQIPHVFKHQTDISPISSCSNELSFERDMRITDTSNEAFKTDDEDRKKQDLIISDVSLQQQRLPNDECEYEIDLGNGWITKSTSSYQSDPKYQQRSTSIISGDSIHSMNTYQIPFTNTFYRQENSIDHYDKSNILFNSHNYIQQRWPQLSLRTFTIFSIGTTTLLCVIVLIILVF